MPVAIRPRMTLPETASSLRDRAFRDVGLTPANARRLAEERTIDLDERRRLMTAIAAAYGRLYLSAPDRLIWMGFAAIAVNDGVAPTTALAALAAPYSALAEGGLKASFEANFAIFADLYWVHLAYRDGGLDLLRALHRQGALDGELLDGFTLVDDGDVILGNLLLFRREQLAAVTPVFDRYREAIAAATRLGLIVVPNTVIAESCAEMGRSQTFEDESYGPFSARWRWLTACTWEPVVRLHEDRAAGGGRDRMEAEVRRAIAGRREPLGPVVRRALRGLATYAISS